MAVATPCWPAPVSATSAPLAHFEGEETLANDVVDLVAAGVVEVLALQQDAHTRVPGTGCAHSVRALGRPA